MEALNSRTRYSCGGASTDGAVSDLPHELRLNWQTFQFSARKKKSSRKRKEKEKNSGPNFLTSVQVDPDGRAERSEKRELKGSLACLWLFFKEAFLVDQSTRLHTAALKRYFTFLSRFSRGAFVSEEFPAELNFGAMMLSAAAFLWTHNIWLFLLPLQCFGMQL